MECGLIIYFLQVQSGFRVPFVLSKRKFLNALSLRFCGVAGVLLSLCLDSLVECTYLWGTSLGWLKRTAATGLSNVSLLPTSRSNLHCVCVSGCLEERVEE